jgi:quercetin dioxygenase-like cupin family protein
MHPAGDELVVCVAGTITLIQEAPDGTRASVALGAGEYAINPPGTWHTADVAEPATVLFITAGLGTEHRPRAAGLAGG